MKKLKLLIVLVLTIGFINPNFALAQQSNLTPDGKLEISPFLMDLKVLKGESSTVVIDIKNLSLSNLEVNITPRDFLPGDRGQPFFVPDTEINDDTFSLASWISTDKYKLTLEPEEKKSIEFSVNPPTNAEEGTHYGAILFGYGSKDFGSGVDINQNIATILLLAYGEARSSGENILTTSTLVEFNNKKIEFSNKFNNIGNVHVQPKGEIYIKNIFGQTVASPEINRDAANVLPKSDREFLTSWFPGPLSFGRYKAISIITYGQERLEERDEVVVWVFPWYFIALIILAIIFKLWVLLHGRHWYKRRVITKHINK